MPSTYIQRTNDTAYEHAKKNSCLVGQLIFSCCRELGDLDKYLKREDDGSIIGWAFGEHLYDRLIGPNAFKLSRPSFFTYPYSKAKHQACSGFFVGPLVTTAVAGLFAGAILGTPFLWPVIGVFLGALSLAYLVKGIHCIGRAINIACSTKEVQPEKKALDIKLSLQRGLSCFLIALLMPLAWAVTFPLELVRFVSRSIATIVYAIKTTIDEAVASVAAKAMEKACEELHF